MKPLTFLFLLVFSTQTTFCQNVFDLALRTTLAVGEDNRVYPGETVAFTIEVFNQGTVSAENIEVTLMIPAELTSLSGIANMGTITFAGVLPPGSSASQDVEFEVDDNITSAMELIISGEISAYTDDVGNMPADIDSTPDADFTNDSGGIVDSNTDDTINNENGDEDDSDPENVFVEIFDLALRTTLAVGEDDRVYPGETVAFTIEVFNQGTVLAENIEVTLMIPAELTSVSGIANMGTITFVGFLLPGSSVSQDVEFELDDNIISAMELIISGEIIAYTDELGDMSADIDSTPDADFTNDSGGIVDSNTDDAINNENGDEDDSDPENVFVEIFDLALRKTLGVGEDDRVYPGETVAFTIEVFNQGTVDAFDIVVDEYVPSSLTPIGATSFTIDGPLAPGTSQSLGVLYTVSGTAVETIESGTEIQSYEDDLGYSLEDIDSVADNNPDNDPTENDAINNENGDEDDSDIELLNIVPIVDFVSIDYPVLESINQVNICLQLSVESPVEVNAEITYTGGSADVDTDYMAFPAIQQVIFPANSTTAQCFTISLLDDYLIEMNETIEFEITNVTGIETVDIGIRNTTSITILDDDDNDNDNVENTVDNCPDIFNPLQEDLDGDSIGDACDDTNNLSNLSTIAEFQDHIYINKPHSGVIMKSIDGQCWVLVVSNSGSLNIVSVECPD